MLADLKPVAQAWSPDLLVCDAAEFAGPIAAAAVSAPNVTLAFGALLPEPRVAAAGAEVAALWAAHGLEPRPYGGTYDNLYLDIYPSSMQPTDRPHIPATQPLRPDAFATGEAEPLPGWVTAPSPDPLVYVMLGTAFSNDEVLSTVVGTIRELPVRVVVTVGPRGDPASLGPQPGNVHVARLHPPDSASRALRRGRVPRRIGNLPRFHGRRAPTAVRSPGGRPVLQRRGVRSGRGGDRAPAGPRLLRTGERRGRATPLRCHLPCRRHADQQRDLRSAVPAGGRGSAARRLRRAFLGGMRRWVVGGPSEMVAGDAGAGR
jgi:hypothetical protein